MNNFTITTDICEHCKKFGAVAMIGYDIDYEQHAPRICSDCLQEMIDLLPRHK